MSAIAGATAASGTSWNGASLPTTNSSTTSLLQHTSWIGRAQFASCTFPAQLLRCQVGSGGDPSQQTFGFSARELRKAGVSVSSEAQPVSGVQEDVEGLILAPGTDASSIREWELDFCSRPILDARGKRIWELAVCDSKLRLQYTKFYPNNVINSITLKDAIISIIQTQGLPKPEKIRFFRSQMQTIISKACEELDIQPVPSRRCVSLVRWLDSRYESVYQQHPGFQADAAPLLQLEQGFPVDLPDTLRGEQWAFVQLPLQGVLEEVVAVEQGATFGKILSTDSLGLCLSPDAVIPGVSVASARANAVAARLNALELASLEVDKQKACVILSSGVSDRWLYAYYRKNRLADQEADAWEASKRACGGLHFLAVQQTLDADFCTGFWLLFDWPRARV